MCKYNLIFYLGASWIMDGSEVIETLLNSFDYFFLAFFSEFVEFIVDGVFVFGEEGSDGFVVDEGAEGGLGVEEGEGENDPEGHVGKSIEK